MRQAGVSLIAQMVITIGLSILLRYLFLYNFGGNPRFFRDFAGQRAISIGPVEITPKDLTAMIISMIVLVVVGALLQLTRIGKAMRAVVSVRSSMVTPPDASRATPDAAAPEAAAEAATAQ